VFWIVVVALFLFFGYFATQIHLEEDINSLMPSSKNEDGTTKLAFANLRIKDKIYILFQGENPDVTAAACDAFVDSLSARDKDSSMVEDVFYRIPEDIIGDMIEYLSAHLPAYIDTSAYSAIDTMLTTVHFEEQMRRNRDDLEGDFGSMYPELIEMDPIGIRNVLMNQFASLTGTGSSTGGGFTILNDHIFSKDSTVCIAFVTPAVAATNTGEGNALIKTINEVIKSMSGDVKVYYHGTPANGYYNSSIIKNDLLWTIGISMLLVVIFLVICFRTWRIIPLLILPVVFGTFFGLAMMYFIKGELSLLSLAIGAIVLGVALSYALHVITHHAYVGDAERVIRDEAKPVMLGCITTIGSFVGIIFIHTDLLRDFGMFAAFAILATTLFSLIFLPVILGKGGQKMPQFIERASNYSLDRSKPLIAVIGVITLICVIAFFIGGVNFDANMRNLGYIPDNLAQSEALYDSKTSTGDKDTYFASYGKTMEEAIEHFADLDKTLDSLQSAGKVISYTHTNDIFVPLKVQQQRIDAWKEYWTSERQTRVRQLIQATAPAAGLNAEAFDSFFEYANADYEPDAMYEAGIIPQGYMSTMMEKSLGGDYLCFTSVKCSKENVSSENSDYFAICKAVSSNPHLMVLDTYYYTRDTLKQLNDDFNVLQWISLLFVFIVLLFSFRFNLKHSVLGFLPIVFSWIIVLGAMSIFSMRFNLINIIISTFIFGIGVDYSIFVMNGLVSKENDKLQYHKTAILLSAVILVLTVGAMLFAAHPTIRSVGFSTLVGLVSAVILSYVVQPAIYRLINKHEV